MGRVPVRPAPGMNGVPKEINQWSEIQTFTVEGKEGDKEVKCGICLGETEYILTAPLKGDAKRYACMWCRQRYNVLFITPAGADHPQYGAF